MAIRLKVDVSGLKEFEKQLKQLQEEDMQQFNEQMVKELAAIALSKLIGKTPVGTYDKPVQFTTKDGKEVSFTPHTGKQGGTLRRGWTSSKESEAATGTGDGKDKIKEHIDLLKVKKVGEIYEIEITNPVNYASWVDTGHRIYLKDKIGWVDGNFMVKITEEEMESQGPAIIERRLKAFLKEALDGK
ncbi:HK97 gp10 family phage protein [Anaerocolumna sp.]|uniref:HK97 gp10 family phage protein n=1 Tax=Anaerocolumna sp. TaxID=2041569 RepID=UPI0028ACD4FE|nr:HK97 gp10 family phage protein [Anaerocolumna sp.]